MSKYCIGIDLGGTFIKFVTMDRAHNRGKVFQLPTPADEGAEGVVRQMVCGARQAMEQAGLTAEDVLGVGIGSPGPLSPSEGKIFSLPNIAGMQGFPLRDRVAQELGLPAVLENDACAAAYAEYLCGIGQGTHDMVMLTLGTGVGGGIILEGKVFHSIHEIGAHLGHMIVVPGGEQCGCGQKGCLERYCSARYLAERATSKLATESVDSSLSETLASKGSIDARDINEARKAGDAFAESVWDEAMRYLAIGCVNVCRIFDPDRIVLAGGLTKAGDDLLEPLAKHFQREHWKMTDIKTELAIASLGSDSGAIGAAGVAWQELVG